jgi:hypothetical protein
MPESDIVTWPSCELAALLQVGFLTKTHPVSLFLLQMGFATLVLAAFVALLAFWQTLVKYLRFLWKA